MFTLIPDLLNADDLAAVRKAADRTEFEDGRKTNRGHPDKVNLQAPPDAPGVADASRLIKERLWAHATFKSAARPKSMTLPRLCRYDEAMHYGAHVDAAFLVGHEQSLRTDVSCTVFLSDARDYEGGELVVKLGDGAMALKEPAGSAVVYPSDTIHEVRPVTAGRRLVAIAFIESLIPNREDREMLASLEALHRGAGGRLERAEKVALNAVIQKLLRRWSG